MEENLEAKDNVTKDGEDKKSCLCNSFAGKLGLPDGYSFAPNVHELVMDFLMNKIMGCELPDNPIEEIDLYACDPHELPSNASKHRFENQGYFFTLVPQSLTETEPTTRIRIAKGGYWMATGEEKKIYLDGDIVGYKNTFVFYMGQAPKGMKSSWVMEEFRVNPILAPLSQVSDSIKTRLERYVVCRIINMAI